MHTIENDLLKVTIQSKGAELTSVYHKQLNMEYMWGADPAFWAKSSPVLFPIVGTLKNNSYGYNGQTYKMSRHGFARDKEFAVAAQSKTAITFSLTGDEETARVFPFSFIFSITYEVTEAALSVKYTVQNTGDDEMYFSVGGHPAFRLPLVPNTAYNDYYLQFDHVENTGRWPISKDGLIEEEADPLLNDTDILPLSKELFAKDALVIKHPASDAVSLLSHKTPHGLQFTFAGFPFLGLWAAPGADFLCIEPWCGIADSVGSTGKWPGKEGLEQLASEAIFERTWQVQLF